MADPTQPLLAALDARLDVGGTPQVDGLNLRTASSRVVVLGAATALFEAASGLRRPSRGAVRVRGELADAALRAGRVAGASLTPPLPPKWTPRTYAQWSAELAGIDRDLARRSVEENVDRLAMQGVADTPLAKAAVVVRRATVVLGALATGAPVIVLEDPTVGLPDLAARTFGRVLTTALEGRQWLVFAAKMALGAPLALQAEEAIVIDGSQVVAQGAPGEVAAKERTFALKVAGDVAALAEMVRARGLSVTQSRSTLVVELSEGATTKDLLSWALETHSTILEMSPITRALA